MSTRVALRVVDVADSERWSRTFELGRYVLSLEERRYTLGLE
jgi:hypothetical protein